MVAVRRILVFVLLSQVLFECADSPSNKPLVFYVLGDWGRKGEADQLVIADQMNEWTKQQDPKFILTVGDNFYNDGVADLNDPHWKESFENVYKGDNLIKKPWYVSLGNHDYRGNVDAQIQYKKIDQRWNMPSRYYSRVEDLGDGTRVRIVFIDTTPFEKDYYGDPAMQKNLASQDTVKQKKWLDSLTSLSDATWKIVVGHHHVYTGGARVNEPSPIRPGLEPIFEKNKVDLYFCGHEHDLQHLKASGKPTNYFLSGGGSDLRPTGMGKESIFAASENGFMSVSVEKSKVTVAIVNYEGQVLYTTTINK